jgi:hypothetical protein
MVEAKHSVAVVYLARAAEGRGAFRRFAESYRRQPAERDHQLIIIYKGFEQRRDLLQARAVFDGLPHLGLELDDIGFDIGAYLEASRRVPHDYLCFLNTHSELAASGWLARLADHALREGVGIAGAMGSYESLFDSILLMRHARWACDYFLTDGDREKIEFYYGFLLGRASGDGADGISNTALMPRLPPAVRRILRYPWYRWKAMSRLWPGAQIIDIRQFPAFPNPHLRSNGFIIRRERLRRFDRVRMASKSDANMFESGAHSLTAQLRREGLAAIVVGRDGHGYDVPNWPRSKTFRLGDQENLLLSDNQSRSFAAMSAGARATHRRITWGDYLGPAPRDFPDLGFAFRAKH